MKFTIPLDGKYAITANYFKHNGKYKEIENPSRKWWQFWKPKTVMIQDGEWVGMPTEFITMKVGDSVACEVRQYMNVDKV